MGLFDFLKKNKENIDTLDPLSGLVLSKLKPGYLVDYDMKTWEVKGYNRYDWDGEYTEEWEFTSEDEVLYLEREQDDSEAEWSISKKIALSGIERSVFEKIKRDEEPSDRIEMEGVSYYLSDTGAGYFLKGGSGIGDGIIFWDFEDEKEENFITIEQWGEDDFQLSKGFYVEEYQFTNILPK